MKIKELRENLGLSQKELADRAGVAQSTVHYIETGRSPEYKTLKKIAKALNVSVAALDDDAQKAV